MKRAITAAMVTAIASAGLVAAVAPPASADTDTCASRGEYRRVHNGMSIQRVRSIFDISGRQSFAGPGYQSRDYNGCGSRYAEVTVLFYHRQVDSKYAYWG